MKVIPTLCVVAAIAAGPVYADCTPPNDAVSIPSGASASRDDMVAAQKAVRAYDTAVKEYSNCLLQEQDAKVAAGGDPAKLAQEYAKRQNDEVDKLQKVAERFNTELRAFKAKNSG